MTRSSVKVGTSTFKTVEASVLTKPKSDMVQPRLCSHERMLQSRQ